MKNFILKINRALAAKKKIFLFIAVILTAGMLQAETIYGDCGPNMEWEFNTGSGALFLIGTGPMDDYDSIEVTPWAQYKDQIRSIQKDSRSQYTSIGKRAFYNCENLESVDLPNTVTLINTSAFWNCEGLTSLTLGNSIESIEYFAFAYCSGLTSISLPGTVKEIGGFAFHGCSGLTTITIPASVESIGSSAFSFCLQLTSITVDADNAYYSAKDGVLYNKNQTVICQYPAGKTGSFDIPNTVTEIIYEAFYGCYSLTSITIPNSVASIGNYAFEHCLFLTSITCEAMTPPTCGVGVFNQVNKTIPLYVHASAVKAYGEANIWKEFTNIQSIPGTEGIEQPTSDSSLKGRANKVIKDGQLYIERNGKTYNAQGAEVK